MAGEPVEVAIQKALTDRATAFAQAQDPDIAISYPNVAFTPPPATKKVGQNTVYGRWLRASFLPAPSFGAGIAFDATNQHYGIFQLDVFYGQGAGEYAPAGIAAQIIEYFPRGTWCLQDGFIVQVQKQPYRSSMLKDDPWVMIPVSIPYLCFAAPA